jgi:hypothetical protein
MMPLLQRRPQLRSRLETERISHERRSKHPFPPLYQKPQTVLDVSASPDLDTPYDDAAGKRRLYSVRDG